MSTADRSANARHLVDPELLEFLDSFPPLRLNADRLELIRTAPSLRGLDPHALYPDVTTTEHFVPSRDGDPDVRVLHYEPSARTSTGALVWIHGGGHVMGTVELDEVICRWIATSVGIAVTSVDYRLAPETTAPGNVHDCYAALAWVHDNADELGIDRARVAVGGASAGGGLAANLSVLARDRGEYQVCFQLLQYPMLDDRSGSTIDRGPYAGQFLWTVSDNQFAWRCLLGCEPGADVVPAYAAATRTESLDGLPPAFVSVGSLDLFLAEDVEYAERLLAAGVPTELHVYPGGYHAFDAVSGARIARQHARDFIAALTQHIGPTSSTPPPAAPSAG